MATQQPRTVAQAVEWLCAMLPEPVLAQIQNTPEEDLILLHFSLGTHIRNMLDLWHGNEALRNDAGRVHPDDVALVLIEALWKKLRISLD